MKGHLILWGFMLSFVGFLIGFPMLLVDGFGPQFIGFCLSVIFVVMGLEIIKNKDEVCEAADEFNRFIDRLI